MAENEPIDISQLEALLKGNEVVDKLKQLAAMFNDLGDHTGTVEEKLEELTKELSNTDAGFGKNANTSALFKKSIIDSAFAIEALTVNIGKGSVAFAELSKSASDSTASIAASFNELGKFRDFGGKLQDIFTSAASKIGMGKVAEAVGGSVDKMLQATMRVQGMESGFIGLQAATGNLGTVFDKTGKFASDFDGKILKFNDNIIASARATGLSVQQITEATQKLGQIPGALSETIITAKGPTSEVIAATQLAAGSGQKLEAVISQLASAYSELNLKGQDAIDFISTISATSSALKIPLDATKDSINTLAKSYAFLTNNTEGAVKAFSQFVPALQNAGLSPQQAISMFNQMAQSIGQMDKASKSFLAQRSGAGTGLQGAFKIDQMVADGKIDQVMKMMQQNLMRQFNGNVVTLDQASNSQQAAVQYQRQLEFLKSSAFGGMIKDDQQAAKLFQAMKSGDLMKAAPDVVRGTDATRQVTQQGSSAQERMHNIVNSIAAEVQKIAMSEDRMLAFMMRRFGGTAEGSPAKALIEDLRSRAESSQSMVDKIDYANPEHANVETLKEVMGTLGEAKRAYIGEKDVLGNRILHPEQKLPAPRGPQASPAVQPMADDKLRRLAGLPPTTTTAPNVARAVNQNIRATQPTSAVPTTTIGAATSSPQTITAQLVPGQINVTGKIEGFCINCKQTMEAGHIHSAVVEAVDASSGRDRSRVTMPARK